MRKFILTISLLGGLAPSAWCVPQALNFQGRLLESGALVNGNRAMTFKIFDAASGGSPLFTESRSVNVSTGTFNVLVGDATTGGVPLSVFDGGDRYIEVQVGAQILPRQRVVSVGYSFRSDSASFATQAGSLLTATTAQPVVINVTQVNVTTISVTSIIASSATVTGSLKVGNHTIILGENPATGGVPNTIAFESGDAFIKTQDPSAGNLTLEAGANKNILLGGGGNVGIGTASPGAKLDVAAGGIASGQANTTTGGLTLYNAASPNATVLQAGNATSAVTYKLPPADGLAGQVLSTDGAGGLIWITAVIAQQPVINRVSPQAGPVTGGTQVTITGNGFQNGATIKFGGVAATGVTFVSVTTLVAVTPPLPAGAKDVVVTNPGNQQGLLAGGYSYVDLIGCANGTNNQIYASNMIGCNGDVPWAQSAALCNQSGGWHQCSLAEYGARRGGLSPDRNRWLAQQPSDFSFSRSFDCITSLITQSAPISLDPAFGNWYAYPTPNCGGVTTGGELGPCQQLPLGGPNACTAAGGIFRAASTPLTVSTPGAMCCN